MTLSASIADTPFGPMTILSSGATVRAAAFGEDVDGVRGRLAQPWRDERVVLGDSRGAEALSEYFAGDVDALDRVDVEQPGGDYFTAVWREMRAIPPGTTVSYSELAARAGAPRAVRAAASACARNAVCLFVPCHRVVRSDGSLGGYYYGLDVKERLLTHERDHRLRRRVDAAVA